MTWTLPIFRFAAPLTAILLSLQVGQAYASCAAPPSPIQALICNTPELQEADRAVRALEQQVARTTPRAASTALRAQSWLRMMEAGETLPAPRPHTVAELLDRHASRQHELRETLRQDRAMHRIVAPGAVTPRPMLEQRCLGHALSNCRVSATGLVVSEDRGTRLLWQAQSGFTEADGVRAGMILWAEARDGWRMIGWAFEGASYGAPQLHAQPGGALLVVPGSRAGSGRGNADLLFQRRREGWREIETESWRDTALERLPRGLTIRQAVAFDFGNLAATARLSRDADANCCATGGTATLGFTIEGGSLVLNTV